MEKIRGIVHRTRRTGNTTWILRSAIKTPKCIIVCGNMNQADHIESAYRRLLQKEPWLKKFWWKLFGREHPKFVNLDYPFEGTRLPVIFDNGSFL